MTKDRKGFTLLELMTVILVLAALAALAVPKYAGSIKNSQAKQCLASRKIIEHAAERYAADHDGVEASIGTLVADGGLVRRDVARTAATVAATIRHGQKQQAHRRSETPTTLSGHIPLHGNLPIRRECYQRPAGQTSPGPVPDPGRNAGRVGRAGCADLRSAPSGGMIPSCGARL